MLATRRAYSNATRSGSVSTVAHAAAQGHLETVLARRDPGLQHAPSVATPAIKHPVDT
jgi:hypothetical protein